MRFRLQRASTNAATSPSAESSNGSRFAAKIATIPSFCSCTAAQATSPIPGRSRSSLPGKGTSPSCNGRSEEHTSELQSHSDLVCRLLLEKKKKKKTTEQSTTRN